jgi:hypothetical protein
LSLWNQLGTNFAYLREDGQIDIRKERRLNVRVFRLLGKAAIFIGSISILPLPLVRMVLPFSASLSGFSWANRSFGCRPFLGGGSLTQQAAEKGLDLTRSPEKHPSGAEAPLLFCRIYGTTKVVP